MNHLEPGSISSYIAGDLSKGEVAVVEMHLAECRECTVACNGLKRMYASLRAHTSATTSERFVSDVMRSIRVIEPDHSESFMDRVRLWLAPAAVCAASFGLIALGNLSIDRMQSKAQVSNSEVDLYVDMDSMIEGDTMFEGESDA